MTTDELLTKLRNQGVTFSLVENKGAFKWHCDDGLSPHYQQKINEHKAEIAQMLRDEEIRPKYGLDDVPEKPARKGTSCGAFAGITPAGHVSSVTLICAGSIISRSIHTSSHSRA